MTEQGHAGLRSFIFSLNFDGQLRLDLKLQPHLRQAIDVKARKELTRTKVGDEAVGRGGRAEVVG